MAKITKKNKSIKKKKNEIITKNDFDESLKSSLSNSRETEFIFQ